MRLFIFLSLIIVATYKQDFILDSISNLNQSSGTLTEQTEKAIEYADSLQEAIAEFEDSREGIDKDIEASTKGTLSDLELIESSSLRSSVKNWAEKWDGVKHRFDELKDSFDEVKNSSENYFSKLNEIANHINNPELKESEKVKNSSLQNSWNSVLKESATNIDSLNSLILEGDDFHRVLLGTSIREKLGDSIGELKEISVKAEKLLSELKKLTLEGKKLRAEI